MRVVVHYAVLSGLFFGCLLNFAMSGEIVNVTLDNWSELMVGEDLGVVLIVSTSFAWASGYYDYELMANMFDNDDSDNKNRLVGFVNCRTDDQFCKEMGIYTNPTLRFGRPESLEELRGIVDRPDVPRILPALLDAAMEYDLNPVFSPSSLDVSSTSLSQVESSFHTNISKHAVLTRYCVPRSGECRRTQPDWERLALRYNQDSSKILVTEVDCSAEDLHKDHEHSCSWGWGDYVAYSQGGYKTKFQRKGDWVVSGTMRHLFKFDDLESLAEELTAVDPIMLTNSTWSAPNLFVPGRNVLVLFTSPKCCLQVRDTPYGSNESIGCFGGFETGSNEEVDYPSWQEQFPVVCQQAQLEMVRLATRYVNDWDSLIATVDCEQEEDLCKRLPVSVHRLPMILHGQVPDLSYSLEFFYPFGGIILNQTSYHPVSPIEVAETFMGKPVSLNDQTTPHDQAIPHNKTTPGDQTISDDNETLHLDLRWVFLAAFAIMVFCFSATMGVRRCEKRRLRQY